MTGAASTVGGLPIDSSLGGPPRATTAGHRARREPVRGAAQGEPDRMARRAAEEERVSSSETRSSGRTPPLKTQPQEPHAIAADAARAALTGERERCAGEHQSSFGPDEKRSVFAQLAMARVDRERWEFRKARPGLSRRWPKLLLLPCRDY